ncbi:hypothetical protein Ciccas_004995 [Cichlidogyrus casuarinus]|uniref:Uncharacterized protein n=1 Tax=Cichlidogyrus casuarinus TaxID=1844966 RepID=A0ABD2Q9X3_9PLAT
MNWSLRRKVILGSTLGHTGRLLDTRLADLARMDSSIYEHPFQKISSSYIAKRTVMLKSNSTHRSQNDQLAICHQRKFAYTFEAPRRASAGMLSIKHCAEF